MYIAIEGLDGSGGTTQLARLAEACARRAPGLEIVRTREPSDGPVGRLIRAQLAGGEVGDAVLPHLFAADRRDHLDRVVLPALARGAWVLSDRCVLSSLAYQAPVAGLPRVLALNADVRLPDLTLLLELAPEVSLARVEARGGVRDRFETLDVLRRVRDAYDLAVDALRGRGGPRRAGGRFGDARRRGERHRGGRMAALRRLGRAPYAEVLALQEELLARRIADEIPDVVVLVEHDPVYTVGRRKGASDNLLAVGDTPVVEVARGGDVTWHGPGQAVAYPIVRLRDQDLHAHMRRLEAVMVEVCAAFGLRAGPDARNTGTWIDGRKVGSVGVACRSWVSWHGLALNVDPDLSWFARIHPCGFPSDIMTSMTREKGAPVALDAVFDAMADRFAAW